MFKNCQSNKDKSIVNVQDVFILLMRNDKNVTVLYYLHFLRNLWMDNSENRFYTEATYNKMKFREI